jgi:drug/metabolite transporter (DMT)-like permease
VSTGLLLGLFSSLTWGIVDVTGALAGRRVGSTAVLAGAHVVGVTAIALIVIADPSRLGGAAVAGFLAGLPVGIGAAMAYLSYFTALRIGPLSVVSPVILAYGGATVVLAVLLRGETLQPAQALGTLLATAGVVLAGIVFHGGTLRGMRIVGPGVLVAALTIVLFAVVTVALAAPIQAYGWLPVAFGSRFANATVGVVLLLVVLLRSRSRRAAASAGGPDGSAPTGSAVAVPVLAGGPGVIAAGPGTLARSTARLDRVALGLIVVTGLCDVLGFVAFAVGLGVAPTWLVGLASSFGPVIAVVFAVRRLGERLRPTQWAGMAMLGVGIVVLAIAG